MNEAKAGKFLGARMLYLQASDQLTGWLGEPCGTYKQKSTPAAAGFQVTCEILDYRVFFPRLIL